MTEQSIGLIMLTLTLSVHLIATVWWAASLTKRVEHMERWILSNEHTAERLAALELQIDHIGGGISRIEQYLRAKG
jgi:hypothetical protein